MGTLSENLSYIDAIKSDIKSAIEDKGVDMTGYSFPDYPAAISQISGGGNLGYIYIDQNGYYEASSYGIDGWNLADVVISGAGEGYDQVALCQRNFAISVLANSASYVGRAAFYNDQKLLEVSLSSCLYVDMQAFVGCGSLSSVSLPICSAIRSYAFDQCYQLNTVYVPQVQSISDRVFEGCLGLSEINLPVCGYIGRGAFSGCSNLRSVYLRSTSVCDTAFHGPIPSGQSTTFYVPSSLVSDYQAHSIWGSYNIESLP